MGVARFTQANFKWYTRFQDTRFKRLAVFTAAKSESAFSLAGAVFDDVPEFEQMHFTEAPRLDALTIQPGRFARLRASYNNTKRARILGAVPLWFGEWVLENIVGRSAEVPRWRSLRGLAVAAHDHGKEQEFFRRELKARRFTSEPWYQTLLFSFPYQILSDLGNSLLRPVFFLLAALVLFSACYLHLAHRDAPGYREGIELVLADGVPHLLWGAEPDRALRCAPYTVHPYGRWGQQEEVLPGDPVSSALALSARNSLVFAAGVLGEKNREIQACLYGLQTIGNREEPAIPTRVALLGAVQIVVSLILLFLFGLALRNHFRIG